MRRVAELDGEPEDEPAGAAPAPENDPEDAAPAEPDAAAARTGASAGGAVGLVGEEGRGSGAEALTEGPVWVFATWQRRRRRRKYER